MLELFFTFCRASHLVQLYRTYVCSEYLYLQFGVWFGFCHMMLCIAWFMLLCSGLQHQITRKWYTIYSTYMIYRLLQLSVTLN